jgi:hypothetical protein
MLAALVAVAAAAALAPSPAVAKSSSAPPLYDAVFLNTGFVCRWETRCIERQRDSMKRALKYVRKRNPPTWRIQQCNRNAGRNRQRVDWVGFDHCIRNPALRYVPPPPIQKRRTRSRR